MSKSTKIKCPIETCTFEYPHQHDASGVRRDWLVDAMSLRRALRNIAALGVYCCDTENLGHECEAVKIANEALSE